MRSLGLSSPVLSLYRGWSYHRSHRWLGCYPICFSWHALILGFAYFGGRIGELQALPADEPNRIERAHKAGLAHTVGLGMSMVGKLIYATLGFGLAIGQFMLQ